MKLGKRLFQAWMVKQFVGAKGRGSLLRSRHDPGGNFPGTAGLVLSIVSLFVCGVLAPISLILSFFGLFQRPRGRAVAGMAISLVGIVLMIIVAIPAMVARVTGNTPPPRSGPPSQGPERIEQAITPAPSSADPLAEADAAVAALQRKMILLESELTLDEGRTVLRNQPAVRYERASGGEGFQVRHRGEDQRFNSRDDVVVAVDMPSLEVPETGATTEVPADAAP